MTTSITTFKTPEVTVRFSNMEIDALRKKFTMLVETKSAKQRKFVGKIVSGNITAELADYFSLLKDEKVKVPADNEQGYEFIPTGKKLTNFQKYLKKAGIEYYPNILKDLSFEAYNTSEDYKSNPFRLVVYAGGNSTLTLVNISSKVKISHVDTTTGEVSDKYYHRLFTDSNGNTRRSFVIPKNYRRLMVQEVKEVEVLQD